MQVPPPPDLEINAKDNLEQISNITDNRGNTEWLTYGHAPNIFMEGMDGSLWIR